MLCAHEPLVCYSLPCCAQGLASPTGSGLPPESGTETHFNRQALNFDRALPGPPLSAVPSLPRLLGFAGARLRFPSPTPVQSTCVQRVRTCECYTGGASPLAPACVAAGFRTVWCCFASSSLHKTSCCAGAIPFLALSPPVAAALPLLPVDLVANAGTLQACALSLLFDRVSL